MSAGSVSPPSNSETNPREQNPHLPLRQDLSREEVRVLRECSTESFWFRCIPLSIVFVSASQYAVTKGYLSKHPKYGALLKNMGAVFVGYILGKISYQGECRKKLLALPDSRLADAVRKKHGSWQRTEEMNAPVQRPMSRLPASEKPLNEVYSGMDFDSEANATKSFQGLDDGQRPSLDNEVKSRPAEEEIQSSSYANYDDLREKNRARYDERSKGRPPSAGQQGNDPYSTRPWPVPSPRDVRPSQNPSPPAPRKQTTGSNQYGDVWDE